MKSTQGGSPTNVQVAPGYTLEKLVPGSAFHTINGMAFGPDGRLYIASVIGESLFALNLVTGEAETIEGPPQGACDDLVFTSSGEIIWTANVAGAVRKRGTDGTIRDLATNLPGINSIALTRDGKRLFAGQVFMGEGLWEIDLEGKMPPRLVREHTGGFNACQVGPDGLIYGPSWNEGKVLRIHPETGECSVLAEGMKHPGAVKFDLQDRLYALDDATGELFHINLANLERTLIAKLATATDNVVVGPDGAMYVSNMVDNSVDRVDLETGAVRQIIKAALAFPRAIAVSHHNIATQIHVADSCSYRTVDPATGAVEDRARVMDSTLGFPVSGVSVSGDDVILTCELFGVVQVVRPSSPAPETIASGLSLPADAVRLQDGRLIITEPLQGHVLMLDGEKRSTLVENLSLPVGLADAGDDAIYVTECGKGRLLRISVPSGSVESVTGTPLGAVRAVTVLPDERVAVLEGQEGTLSVVDPRSGAVELVARNLGVGYLSHPYVRSGGIAAGPDGTLFVSADRENALYALKPLSTQNGNTRNETHTAL